jgi:hypothetical protein
MALRCHAKLGEGTQLTLILNQSLNVGFLFNVAIWQPHLSAEIF